jgi:hypothetical protein
VTEPSDFEFAMATEKIKRHKSPCIDPIPADLTKAGSRTIRTEIHKLVNSVWNMEGLPEESLIIPIYKKSDKIYCGNYRGISLLSTTYKIIPTFCC